MCKNGLALDHSFCRVNLNNQSLIDPAGTGDMELTNQPLSSGSWLQIL